jgi:hypothetical protein
MTLQEDDGLGGEFTSSPARQSKYVPMYDACKQGHRILVEGVPAKLLTNKMHQLSTRYRREAGQYGMEYPAVQVHTLTTARGVELWFTEAAPVPPCFTILPPSGGTP